MHIPYNIIILWPTRLADHRGHGRNNRRVGRAVSSLRGERLLGHIGRRAGPPLAHHLLRRAVQPPRLRVQEQAAVHLARLPVHGESEPPRLGFPSFPTAKPGTKTKTFVALTECHKRFRFRTSSCSWENLEILTWAVSPPTNSMAEGGKWGHRCKRHSQS